VAASPRWSQADLWDLFDLSPVSDSDLQSYLDITLVKCVSWFRASGGSIFLGEPASGYTIRTKFGKQESLPDDAHIAHGQGIAGIVAYSGVARIIDDPRLSPDFAEVRGNESIASAMVLPLVDTKRQAIGVLNISRESGESPFTDRDLDQAAALAAHVALAVSNAFLVTTLKEQVGETMIANEKLLAVLDSVAGAVVVVDQDGQILNHNQAAAADAFLGSFQEADLSQLGTVLRGTVSEVNSVGELVQRQAHDPATDRFWLVQGTPLTSGGGVITVQEITDHEREQREVARVKRLAEIGQMTAAIAHEIRNPLTGIRSAAQMIRQHPELLPDFIGIVEEEATKLNSLCEEFLEFARPMQLNLEETDLNSLLLPIAKVQQVEFEESGIVLEVSVAETTKPILVDRRRLGQVIHNLLRNAREASGSGDTVILEIGATGFSVTDHGVGISEDEKARLFSPFFTTKASGTGLGLCNARKIIDAHRGEIAVESAPGEGSRFTVTLDRCAA